LKESQAALQDVKEPEPKTQTVTEDKPKEQQTESQDVSIINMWFFKEKTEEFNS